MQIGFIISLTKKEVSSRVPTIYDLYSEILKKLCFVVFKGTYNKHRFDRWVDGCVFSSILGKSSGFLPCVYLRISYIIQFYLNLVFLAMGNAVLEKSFLVIMR